MNIGIVSDTHNCIENFSKAVVFLKNLGVERIVHLGDNYSDADEIGEENILRVPGVFSEDYQNPDIPNRVIENYSGWRVLLTHTVSSHSNDLPDDVKPESVIQNKDVDIVLYGHTHIPDIKKEKGIIFINPGHLKDGDKKGYPPTFGLIGITEDDVFVRIYKLKDNTLLKEERYRR